MIRQLESIARDLERETTDSGPRALARVSISRAPSLVRARFSLFRTSFSFRIVAAVFPFLAFAFVSMPVPVVTSLSVFAVVIVSRAPLAISIDDADFCS